MLTVAACSSYCSVLGERPDDLRARLRTETGQSFRRISRFIELSLLGAQACSREGGVANDAALYLCSEAGTLGDSTRIIADMIAQRRPPSPVEFINVSANLAGYYIAQHLGLDAPQMVVHRYQASFEAALELVLLRSDRQARALVGFVEEGVWPLDQHRARLDWSGAIAECSHWLYVDGAAAQAAGRIERLDTHADLDRALRSLDGADLADCELALGAGWSAPEAAEVQRHLRIGARRPQLDDATWSCGRSAQALCEYLARPTARRLLYLNRVDRGECYVMLARAG